MNDPMLILNVPGWFLYIVAAWLVVSIAESIIIAKRHIHDMEIAKHGVKQPKIVEEIGKKMEHQRVHYECRAEIGSHSFFQMFRPDDPEDPRLVDQRKAEKYLGRLLPDVFRAKEYENMLLELLERGVEEGHVDPGDQIKNVIEKMRDL